jgi:hypothetical protein
MVGLRAMVSVSVALVRRLASRSVARVGERATARIKPCGVETGDWRTAIGDRRRQTAEDAKQLRSKTSTLTLRFVFFGVLSR